MGRALSYITDLEYTAGFNAHQSPAWLAYVAAVNGYAAPRVDRPFRWCELGCGKGLTALLLAALHPAGEFHACDLNPAHVAYAERLRAAARVDNLRLHDASIGQMLGRELPAFDFITLHGVFSWVPEAVRSEIVDFARARLKPGGLLMVTYNAMPGWAHAQPIRAMMQAVAAALPGDPVEKARAAFRQVLSLAERGAAYFRVNPAAAAHLRDMASRDIRYVVHEYLTPHADPFYFAEVEARMRAAGFAFAGSMVPADHEPELSVAREAERDFMLNTSFRADLYAAQPATARPAQLGLERFAGLAFCLAGLPDEFAGAGPAQAVYGLLAAGPAPAREIQRAAGFGEARTAALVQELVAAKHIAPCAAACPTAGWMPVNSVLVEAGIREKALQVPLASPRAGTASQSEVVHAAAIESAACFDAAEPAARSVLARLRAHDHPVNRYQPGNARRPATDEEVIQYVAATWRGLRDPASREGRRLRLFGILA